MDPELIEDAIEGKGVTRVLAIIVIVCNAGALLCWLISILCEVLG